jgi:hypothetical protein
MKRSELEGPDITVYPSRLLLDRFNPDGTRLEVTLRVREATGMAYQVDELNGMYREQVMGIGPNRFGPWKKFEPEDDEELPLPPPEVSGSEETA